MNDYIRILIVEDHQIVRVGLKVILNSIGGFLVVDEADNGATAIEMAAQASPHVVLMDIALPGTDGIEATYQIKTRCPQIKVIMLTSYDSDKDILASMGSGADGFCLKDIPPNQLVAAIKHVSAGGIWLDHRIAERLKKSQGIDDSMQETFALDAHVLDLLCYVEQGLSNEEIAKEMNLSAVELRAMMRQAVNSLFLAHNEEERPKQLRKQFAAKIGDRAINSSRSQNLIVGERFAQKYVIESLIGRGGMGRLYKARHVHTDKVVAIKVLLPQFAADRRVARLFQEEAKAASALDHPNIVRILDYGATESSHSFIVMDYIEGTTLEALLRERILTINEFYDIFDQICNALIAAHSKDIIHCDIKPGNIVLINNSSGAYTVKLIDFGLAKILPPPQTSVQMQLTDSFDICGSPAYMSPEQCRGSKLDARSDLYSVGCVMYESLSGHLAAPGISVMECVSKHLEETPPTFSEVCPERRISQSIEKLIFNLLEKDRALRTQTAVHLKSDIASSFFEFIHKDESS